MCGWVGVVVWGMEPTACVKNTVGDICILRFFLSRRFKIEVSLDTGIIEMSGFFSVRDFCLTIT